MSFTRRETLVGALVTNLLAGRAHAAMLGAEGDATLSEDAAFTLWYDAPAKVWTEALPVGNGRVGAMIYGDPHEEILQLNEDTLWSGGPYDPVNVQARDAIGRVREMIFAGDYVGAEALANEKVMARPLRQMAYQPLGFLRIAHEGLETASGYRRQLDIDSAVARVTFVSGGVTFTRETFASFPDDVIAMRISADRSGSVNLAIRLEGMGEPRNAGSPPSIGDPAGLVPGEAELASGRFPGPHRWKAEMERDRITIKGRNSDHNGVSGALEFVGTVLIHAEGGSITRTDDAMRVRGADAVVLRFAAATSFRSFEDTRGDPGRKVAKALESKRTESFERLRSEHVAAHRDLFRRVSLDLGSSRAQRQSTDVRLSRSLHQVDPGLVTLYFQYARYLLISSSRPGSQPANLQGIWNDQLLPPWGSKWTININTEMNYFLAEPTALPECVEPLVAMIRDLAQTGARTAGSMYGARGWVAHHNTDLWRASAPCDGAQWGLWPTGGAWLCKHLWDRYDYGRDLSYLRSIYPLMKGAALFFCDTLKTDKRTGRLVTTPSMSPENTHPGGGTLCAGPTMDMQILRDLFTNCIAAADTLGVDTALRAEWTEKREQLVPNQIGGAGQLQEWQLDWDLGAPEINHRHVAHLYGLHPSHQIDAYATPELWRAARRSLDIRGDEATGWGIAWRLLFWARLQDGDHAYRVLRSLLGPDRTYPNMFDAHPPFQIDGNFGGAAGIAELLMQSPPGEIRLLPALPRAWHSGSVTGLRARGGFVVDIAWADGALREAKVLATTDAPLRVRHHASVCEIPSRRGAVFHLSPNGSELSVRGGGSVKRVQR